MTTHSHRHDDGATGTRSHSSLHLRALLALVLSATMLSGCAQPAPQGEGAITVAAASNLTLALSEIARAYEAQGRGEVTLSFGATGNLARQIEEGAPFDLFVSADTETVDRLVSEGFVEAASRAIYARGRLVLWWGDGEPVARLEDLVGRDRSRIAMAKPDIAPYGRAARQALERAGLWRDLEPRVVYAESVSSAEQFVQSGNADFGFLPLALVLDRRPSLLEVDPSLYDPIDQALGVVAESKARDRARAFADFVLGPEGRAILERYGYELPGPAVGAVPGSCLVADAESRATALASSRSLPLAVLGQCLAVARACPERPLAVLGQRRPLDRVRA